MLNSFYKDYFLKRHFGVVKQQKKNVLFSDVNLLFPKAKGVIWYVSKESLQDNLEKVEISTSSINCIVVSLRAFLTPFLGLIHKRASLSDCNRQHYFENCHLYTCGFIDFYIVFTFEVAKSKTK